MRAAVELREGRDEHRSCGVAQHVHGDYERGERQAVRVEFLEHFGNAWREHGGCERRDEG